MSELLEAAGLLYSGPAYTRHADGDLRVSDRYRAAAQLVSSAVLDTIGWKTEPPTEQGWYWCKSPFDVKNRIHIVYVYQSCPQDAWRVVGAFARGPLEDYLWRTEWAGPIPQPTDQPGEAGEANE